MPVWPKELSGQAVDPWLANGGVANAEPSFERGASMPPCAGGLIANLMLWLDEQEFHCQQSPAVYMPGTGFGRMDKPNSL